MAATGGQEPSAGDDWNPAARAAPPPLRPFAQFRADLASHPAWWVVPMLLTLGALSALLLMARGDLHVPAVYRLF
jgi:hypothetical protein